MSSLNRRWRKARTLQVLTCALTLSLALANLVVTAFISGAIVSNIGVAGQQAAACATSCSGHGPGLAERHDLLHREKPATATVNEDGGVSASDSPAVRDLSWEDGERLSARQHELHPSIERVQARAAEHPDLFAGVWLDNDDYLLGTGPVRMVVATTRPDPRDAEPEMSALVDEPDRLVIVHLLHSEAMLKAAQQRFLNRWMPQGQDLVTGCGVDTTANTFMVMLREANPALEDRIRADHPGVPIDFEYSLGYTSG